jgi:tRNA(Ile)-lysidine synthase
MIRLQGKLPRDLYIGVSGGLDSMVVLDFLRRAHDVTVLTFDHGSEYHVKARNLLGRYCADYNIQIIDGRISNIEKPRDLSLEEYWRNERYAFFSNYSKLVITAHHLDDILETWLWSSCHGLSKIIPYNHNNVIRPFRLNTKAELTEWAARNNVPHLEDISNQDTRFMRNYIRHNLVNHALHVNPGLYKVLRKKILADYQDFTCKELLNIVVW